MLVIQIQNLDSEKLLFVHNSVREELLMTED